MHMVPGLLERAPFAVDYDSTRKTLDQYAAEVLALYYRAMLDVAAIDRRVLLVSYEEGFPAAFERIAAWLEIPLDARLRERVHERCARDGKNPKMTFERPETTESSSPALGELPSLFAALEVMRLSSMR
jgi:hypothetical protein